jgi:predicted RNA-binding Zn-ribbon protein involved in translation (DUF1610 family)
MRHERTCPGCGESEIWQKRDTMFGQLLVCPSCECEWSDL